MKHMMAPNQFQSKIQHATCDSSISDQGPNCFTPLLQNPNAQYLPGDVSINSIDGSTLKTQKTDSVFSEDGSIGLSIGMNQVSGEMVRSPEPISSITSCSDGDEYISPAFVDGGLISHDSSMKQASESPPQNFVPHSYFANDSNCRRFPSYVGGNSEVSPSNLKGLQKESQGTREVSGNIEKMSCEDMLKSQLNVAGPRQDECLDRMNYSPLEKSNCFENNLSSETFSILFGPTDASKFVNMNEKTLQEDLLSYMKYKSLHVDGSQVSFVQYMHSTVCNEQTCNCDRFLLVSHFKNCHLWECNICEPVRRLCVTGKPPLESENRENRRTVFSCSRLLTYTGPDAAEDGQPPAKCLKTIKPVSVDGGIAHEISSTTNLNCGPEQKECSQRWSETPFNNVDAAKHGMVAETDRTQLSDSCCLSFSSRELSDNREDVDGEVGDGAGNKVADGFHLFDTFWVSQTPGEFTLDQRDFNGEGVVESGRVKVDVISDSTSVEADPVMNKLKPKPTGVSLIDFFTENEVQEHLSSFGHLSAQETEGMVDFLSENTCQLCAMEKLLFAPAPVYCSSCGARIKPRLYYHSAIDEMGTRHSFCTPCLKASRGSDILFHGICISKQKLQKQINNHVDDESWVQCDKCERWQHQICALYNDKRDLGGKAEYVCPKCYLAGLEVGDYMPLPRTGAFVAKNLPTTLLSDHIEQRLFRCLKQERQERARSAQLKYEEVPGAADLVVRVVLSVSKLLNVKQQFLDIIPDEDYPTEFPFKSKVILLFQKIDGVDVCLFGFYVQEFGSECGHPNQRSVYISYLDSIKYFRPEVKTASGEALRTLVYHEILIGYLDYCKKQGFATCYIWACPPVKGEDYILYCHPDSQKTPKSDKLRRWYKSMLRKAAEEEIAVDFTNLHDYFFIPTGERNSKITAARLPYFDGDYWSVAAMDIVRKIEHGRGAGSQITAKIVLTKRTLKSMGHSNLPGDVVKDILVMQKLGQTISPVKEDFLMIHLQFTCARCHQVILTGSRWFCNQCINFHLCSRCLGNKGNIHVHSSGERHFLSEAAVSDVPVDTDDRDVILDNGYLEYRHSFLSFCQGNHYQFDTLRRAKHSSMMILYHLHNSTVPSVEERCCLCDRNMLVKQGWQCGTCQGFFVCDRCYKRQGSNCHLHQLTRHTSLVNRGSRNGQATSDALLRLRGIMEGLLMHASQCTETKSKTCPYPNCSQIRNLWCHTHQCNLRLAGGCQLCRKTWTLLRLHSESCRDSSCRVPRCMDLKKHAEMLALQSDARQSAAVLGSLRGG